MTVYTESIQFKADQKLLEFIEKKLQKLERLFDRIIEARVVLKLENTGGKIKDKIAEVRINVPGETLIAKQTDKTFEASIANASIALKKQLIKYKDRLKG